MARKIYKQIENLLTNTALSIKSLAKIVLESRRCNVKHTHQDKPLLIMGNGPSLTQTLEQRKELIEGCELMAVNFAALSPEFTQLKPKYYLLADPHFFNATNDPRVDLLHHALGKVDWPMTLLVPHGNKACPNLNVTTRQFNLVAVQGFDWLCDLAYKWGLGMPRPRNVLVPALMTAMKAGFERIYLAGADHSWMSTIRVNDRNEVVTYQPHFYKEDEKEQQRVNAAYRGTRLHEVVYSFYLAFKSYHYVSRYAARNGIIITNITPESMIDAFERG